MSSPSIPIEARLDALRSRVRALVALHGIGKLGLVFAVSIFSLVLVDYLLALPAIPRVLLIAAALTALCLLAWKYLFRPLSRPLSHSDLAGRVEQTFPQFDDRLRSAISFAHAYHSGENSIESEKLRRATREQASQLAGDLDLRRAVSSAPARQAAVGGFVALLLLAGVTAITPPEYRAVALSRLLNPFTAPDWPRHTQIQMLSALPNRVAAGQRLDLSFRLSRGDHASARATLHTQYGDGPVRTELLARNRDGTFAASLDPRADGNDPASLRLWLSSGDDQTNPTVLTVIPRLALRSVLAVITPPSYANLPAAEHDLTQSPAQIVEGATVRLVLTFNRDLSTPPTLSIPSADARQPSTDIPTTDPTHSGPKASLTLRPAASLRFAVTATDTEGLTAPSLTEYEINVRPDQLPSIQIETPRRNEERTAAAIVPLAALAEDDFAIAEVKLLVRRLGDDARWTLPLVLDSAAQPGVDFAPATGTPQRARFRLGFDWPLSSVSPLRPGDVLEYNLTARDNFRITTETGTPPGTPPGSPPVTLVHDPVSSSRLRITIISPEELSARATEELRRAAEQIERLRQAQKRTAAETTQLAEESRDQPKLDEARQTQARRLNEQQSALAAQTRQIQSRLADLLQRLAENKVESKQLTETATDVQGLLQRAAEGPMTDAATELARSRSADKPERNQSLGKSTEAQARADRLLAQAAERLASLGSLRQTLENLSRLLDEQRGLGKESRDLARDNVGKTPEQMSPEDRAKLAELSAKQAELAQRSDKLLQEMDRQSQEMGKSDPQSAEAMKQAAQTGRQQQVSPSQSKAAQQMSQNQQSRAQQEQKRAEIGLEMMLSKLRDAERRKLETLTRKLAELTEQVAVLVRRQASHNLSNLQLRPDALNALPDGERKSLLAHTGLPELPPAPPAADALSGPQEQTERNTRSLADAAGEIETAEEIAALLSRAAGRMERAAVLLRGRDLPAAYEPPQLEALSTLVQALRKAVEAQAEAERQLRQQQRDTLRQLFQGIRDDQQALLTETRRLHDLVQPPNPGELPRAEALRLRQLPEQQAGLSKRASDLDRDLADLGSSIFVFTNKDIVSAMNEARAQLARPDTGKPAQSEQQRAIKQLDAILAALSVKPPEPEFEQPSAGGGGQGKGEARQRMPGEVELRLLKELQTQLNDDTRQTAAEGQAGKPPTDPLAQRQGDLRKMLGEMLEQASNGQFKLGPEPDRKRRLPEELANPADVDLQLDNELLEGKPHGEDADADSASAVDRMGRSRQRLADHDAGEITQRVQKAILGDIDKLIEESRRQQSQQQGQPGQGQPQPGQPRPQPGQPGSEQAGAAQGTQGQRSGGQGRSADGSRGSQPGGPGPTDPARAGGDLSERMAEWGGVTPRQRQAVIDGAGETVVEKYRALIDDYYRALAQKPTGRSNQPGGGGSR
jgi:DNA repair exonuclease SbcCD ATPase subunit